MELLKVLVPYFISIIGAIIAIRIAIYNNTIKTNSRLMDEVEKVDMDSFADGVADK
jgi:hypothetical protein